MYIIAIGWLWVAFMMAITEPSIVSGLLTFLFYGLLPCSLLMYLLGTPGRRRRQKKLERDTAESVQTPAPASALAEPDLPKD
jgi:biotin transporter BioY